MTDAKVLHLREQLSDIYRDYRNVCLSQKYYAYRLRRVNRVNRVYEIVLAVATSGTVAGAIADWSIWQTNYGRTVTLFAGAVIAIATVIKPVLKLPEEIQRLSTLETSFHSLLLDFRLLIFEIKNKHALTEEILKTYKTTYGKVKELIHKEDPDPPDHIVKLLCEEVKREISVKDLWNPIIDKTETERNENDGER